MLILKEQRIQDKKHRGFISTLPCAGCLIEGSSQAAHVTKRGHSKMGGKEHDYYCVPLCHQGANNCHGKLDAYEMEEQREELRELALKLYGADEQTARELIRGLHE